MTNASTLAAECLHQCAEIARFSDAPGTITRTFLSESARSCHAFLGTALEALHLPARIDNAGNLRAIYPAAQSNAPRVVIGSHLDTVPNAGRYDGILGVVLGLAMLKALAGRKLPFEIELIGFSDEEGARFGFPFIGSRAFTGTLDDGLLARQDAAGVSVASAMQHFGLEPSRLRDAVFNPRSIAYLEFHIEQGPILESLGQPVAVVDSISGQSRATVTFLGQTNHAGTTPMQFRRDALAAAAEWIGSVERYARTIEGLVATVGKLDILDSATNVIPGQVTASLDVRHANNDLRGSAFSHLIQQAAHIAKTRSIAFSHAVQLHQNTVPLDARLIALAEQALLSCGLKPMRMSSGAGHDAMIVSPFLPSVMLFLRSPGGLSHHPGETVLVEDVERAIQAGLRLLESIGSTLP